MSEANKALVRRCIDEVWNKGKVELADEFCAADYVARSSSFPELRGVKANQEHVAAWRSGFPDAHFSIEDMIAEGDKVVFRWTFTGTHRGEWMGILPAGKPVTFTGTSTLCVAGGKLAEGSGDFDAMSLWKQLGLVIDPVEAQANKAVARRFIAVVGGKIAEHWADWDALGMFQQLGIMPTLEKARATAQ